MPLTMPKYTKQVGPPESAGFDETRPWLPFREAEGILKTSGQIVEKGQKALAETEAFNEKIKIANQTTTLENAQTRMAVGISDHMQTLQGRTDYQNFMPETAKFFGDLQKEFSDNIQDDEVLELIQNDFELQTAKTRTKVMGVARQQAVDRNLADHHKNIEVRRNQLTDPDPEVRQEARIRGLDLFESAAKSKLITFEKAEIERQNFNQDALVNDAYAYALEFEGIAPDSGVRWLENPENTPGLNNDLRAGAVKELKRVVGLNRAEEEKANDAVYNQYRDNVYKVIQDPKITAAQLIEVRKHVLASDLPTKGLRNKPYLIDLIDKRIDSFSKDEDNPFEKHDPMTYARISELVNTDREALKAEALKNNMKVDSYIYSFVKGEVKDSITANQAKTFLSDFNKFEKAAKPDEPEDPRKGTDFKVQIALLKAYHKRGFFADTDKKYKDFKPEHHKENDNDFANIYQKLEAATKAGEDPKEVLDKLLMPYWEKESFWTLDNFWKGMKSVAAIMQPSLAAMFPGEEEPPPPAKGKELTDNIVRQLLAETGNDPKRAEKLARERGYKF